MARDRAGYLSGDDAAYIKPKLIPDDELLPRDNSGGLDFKPYTQVWGDGGYITGGPKPHLATGDGATGEDGGIDGAISERKDGEAGSRKPSRSKAAYNAG